VRLCLGCNIYLSSLSKIHDKKFVLLIFGLNLHKIVEDNLEQRRKLFNSSALLYLKIFSEPQNFKPAALEGFFLFGFGLVLFVFFFL